VKLDVNDPSLAPLDENSIPPKIQKLADEVGSLTIVEMVLFLNAAGKKFGFSPEQVEEREKERKRRTKERKKQTNKETKKERVIRYESVLLLSLSSFRSQTLVWVVLVEEVLLLLLLPLLLLPLRLLLRQRNQRSRRRKDSQ
jgi:hypothetical protein